MYELFLVACVGAKICQYISAPITYPTITRCEIAAALVAGQVRGTKEPGMRLEYSRECTPERDLATRQSDLATLPDGRR